MLHYASDCQYASTSSKRPLQWPVMLENHHRPPPHAATLTRVHLMRLHHISTWAPFHLKVCFLFPFFFCLNACSFHKWTILITYGPLLAVVKPSFIHHDHTVRIAFLFSWVYHFCNKFGSYDIYAPALEGVLDYILLKPTQRLTYRVCCVSVCIPSRNY